MKGSKCYGLMVNKSVRAIFAGAFLILLGIGLFIMWYFTEFAAFSFLVYVHILGIMAIIMADHFSFGGICSKELAEMGFLKSAVNGLDVVKKAVLVDFFIRSCCAFVLVVAPVVIGNAFMGYEMTTNKMWLMFIMAFAVLFAQNISILVSRHMTTMYIKMMTCSLLSVIAIFAEVITLLDATDENGIQGLSILMGALCLCGYLITSVLSFTDVNRVLKRSFYDQNRGK